MFTSTLILAGLLAVADNGLFSALDTNQDGKVTENEVNASQKSWFTRALRVADADEDGSLSAAELAQALQDPEPREMPRGRGRSRGPGGRQMDPARLDRNNDGVITLDEVPGPGKKRFEMLLERTGRDSVPVEQLARIMGRARRDEMERDGKPMIRSRDAEMKQQSKKKGRQKGQQNKDGDRKGKGQRPDSGQDAKRNKSDRPQRDGQSGNRSPLFDRFDRNGDGAISRLEAPQRLRTMFDRLDTNNDGKITRNELPRNPPGRGNQQRPGRPRKKKPQ